MSTTDVTVRQVFKTLDEELGKVLPGLKKSGYAPIQVSLDRKSVAEGLTDSPAVLMNVTAFLDYILRSKEVPEYVRAGWDEAYQKTMKKHKLSEGWLTHNGGDRFSDSLEQKRLALKAIYEGGNMVVVGKNIGVWLYNFPQPREKMSV